MHDALATLRDATTPPELFRRMAVRISLLLAAEATRDVPADDGHGRRRRSGPPTGARVAGDVVVVPVLRAGLGMLDAVLELLPDGARRPHRPAARRADRRRLAVLLEAAAGPVAAASC